eukprot:gene35817-4487_t
MARWTGWTSMAQLSETPKGMQKGQMSTGRWTEKSWAMPMET